MRFINKTKEQLSKDPDVKECLRDEGFKKWFEHKFMKYGGISDYEDSRVLTDSILYCNDLNNC